ncbi:ArnT family glycosyltransferase [Actinomycetospora aeridis]|uniref:Glycosyltransferase family 39 protein n=1 Tax=Actinomycetospora aeridis TaxID=3129231 RepID=A0ABU8N6P6_9PSEU
MTAGATRTGALSEFVSLAEQPARDPITRTLHPERDPDAGPEILERPEGDPPPEDAPRTVRARERRGGTVPGVLRQVAFWLLLVLLAGATVALRAWHQASAYELFMDEIQYADVGNSFAAGVGPQLFDEPFFLHPPLLFALFGWFIGEPVPHMTVDFVLGLRPIELMFAGVNVVLVVGIARRVVGPWASLVAGLVYALDPFVVRFDSRLMLEAPMMFGILAGVLALLVAVDRATRPARWTWLVVGGLFWGLAITTKSTAALITAFPLVLMFVMSWGLRRKEAVGVLAVQASVYTTYIGWVVATGNVAPWFDQTIAGTLRAIGVIKQTGFNAPHASSFTDRLLAQGVWFFPSYLLIGVAVTYSTYLLLMGWRSLRVGRPKKSSRPGKRRRQGTHARRGECDDLGLLTCWLAGVLGAIVYTFGLGEVEEQTFYLLAVPSTIVVALLVTQMASWRALLRTVATVLVVAVLAASAVIWTTLRTARDDTYHQLVEYMYANIDVQNEVAVGEHTAQFVLPGYGIHELTSVDSARQTFSRYALVSTELTEQGLAPAPPELVDELARRYTLVFTAHGRTAGDLRLYDLNQPLDGTPPVAPGPPR